MKFNIQKIRKNAKKIASFVAIAALTSLAIFPAIGMNAESPRFNFMKGDRELIFGKNITQNSVFRDPVKANIGDVVEGMVYYHNGIENSVAQNTRMKVALPASINNGIAKMSATIIADNADTVTDTYVDGQLVGESGFSITDLPEGAEYEYIPGSVKWYPNNGANTDPNITHELLYGQNGEELFSANGLKIGDINGCWEYAGYVGFRLKIKQVEVSELGIEKTVLNVSKGQTSYSKSVDANQSETARFKISITNSGNTNLDNMVIKDQLPSDLQVVVGSAKLTKGTSTTTINETELLSTSGVDIGTVIPEEIVFITFDATTPSQILVGKSVVNTAEAKSGILSDSDIATVNLLAGITSTKQSKSAVNKTQNVDATKINAKPNDEIEYTLQVENNGSLNVSYQIKDNISDVLEYADVISISDGGVYNNSTSEIEYPSIEILTGSNITRTFTVKVKNPLPANAQNGYSYDFVMYNKFGNEVVVNIEKPVIPIEKKPILSVTKYVRNITNNEIDYVKANTAYAGDMLEYKIVFKNTGNAPADYFKIKDSLPANVSLDDSVAAIVCLNGEERSVAENITLGYIASTIEAGGEGYIRFRAIIAEGLVADETLKNVAFLEDNGVTISDYAETVIKARVKLAKAETPVLPRTGGASAIMYAFIGATIVTGVAAYAYERVKK